MDAYHVPNSKGDISEVFLYQNDSFICKCEPVPIFNRAKAEWTEKDKQGYQDAMKYINEFDKMVKEDTTIIDKVTVFRSVSDSIDVTPEIVPKVLKTEMEYLEDYLRDTDYVNTQSERNKAINDL